MQGTADVEERTWWKGGELHHFATVTDATAAAVPRSAGRDADRGLFVTGAEKHVFSDIDENFVIRVAPAIEPSTISKLKDGSWFIISESSTDGIVHMSDEAWAGEAVCACRHGVNASSGSGPCSCSICMRHDCDKRFGCAARNL